MVRTLNAVHLVSAAYWDLADVELVTYDRRLAAAATDAGMTVIAPGYPPPEKVDPRASGRTVSGAQRQTGISAIQSWSSWLQNTSIR